MNEDLKKHLYALAYAQTMLSSKLPNSRTIPSELDSKEIQSSIEYFDSVYSTALNVYLSKHS